VELQLAQDAQTLVVDTFSVEGRSRRRTSDFRRSDPFEQTLNAQMQDFAHMEDGDAAYAWAVARYQAMRRGVVAAGADPFALEGGAVLDLEESAGEAGSDTCRPLRSRRCQGILAGISDAVAARLSAHE